jgi:NAD/NADP transhydrogenase beta subunit
MPTVTESELIEAGRGAILTRLMAVAMHRSIGSILAGGFSSWADRLRPEVPGPA